MICVQEEKKHIKQLVIIITTLCILHKRRTTQEGSADRAQSLEDEHSLIKI